MLTLDRIKRLNDEKLVTVRALDDLISVKYSRKCEEDKAWSDATVQCRGVIFRVDRPWPESTKIVELVARPFDKFWRVGQDDRWPTTGNLAEITIKEDGFCLVSYKHRDKDRLATLGAFESPQTDWATEVLRSKLKHPLPPNLTFIFEGIWSGDSHVVRYPFEDIILIGVIDKYSGRDFFWKDLNEMSKFFGFRCVAKADISTLEHALELMKTIDDQQEGWVLRYDNGKRWKVKGLAYNEKFRLITRITPSKVLASLASTGVESILDVLPDEFEEEVRGWIKGYESRMRSELTRITTLMAEAPTGSRKDFALWAAKEHKPDAKYLFALLDGRDVVPMIYERMVP